MSSAIVRSAFRASRPLRAPVAFRPTLAYRASGVNAGETPLDDNQAGKEALKKGAKRDPELYSLFAIMCGAFALAGWHFSRSPTNPTSEKAVSKIAGSEPWNSGGEGKYQYHPNNDTSQRKDAPTALNVTIIPNVNLPKSLHDQYNKYGKEGY